MAKGILFDFNGTLFYDSDKHIKAFQLFFEKRGLEVPSAEYLAKMTFGRTNEDIFVDIYKADATPEELSAYGEEKEVLYREACLSSPESFHLADGVEEMLDFLAGKNIPFCIATGAGIDNIKFYFEHLGLSRWFELGKIVYPDGTVRGKPAPDLYLEAARRIGLSADECIVFEDGISGILSANAAGAEAVVFVRSSEIEDPSKDGAIVDMEISDFRAYKDIFVKYGLV